MNNVYRNIEYNQKKKYPYENILSEVVKTGSVCPSNFFSMLEKIAYDRYSLHNISNVNDLLYYRPKDAKFMNDLATRMHQTQEWGTGSHILQGMMQKNFDLGANLNNRIQNIQTYDKQGKFSYLDNKNNLVTIDSTKPGGVDAFNKYRENIMADIKKYKKGGMDIDTQYGHASGIVSMSDYSNSTFLDEDNKPVDKKEFFKDPKNINPNNPSPKPAPGPQPEPQPEPQSGPTPRKGPWPKARDWMKKQSPSGLVGKATLGYMALKGLNWAGDKIWGQG